MSWSFSFEVSPERRPGPGAQEALSPEKAIPRARDRHLRGNGQHGPSERAGLLTAPLRPARRNDTDEAGSRTNLKSGEAVAMQQCCVCRQRASAAKVGSEKGRSLDGCKAVSAGGKCGEASGGGGLEHGNCAPLGIEVVTVKRHVGNILRKLGARNGRGLRSLWRSGMAAADAIEEA